MFLATSSVCFGTGSSETRCSIEQKGFIPQYKLVTSSATQVLFLHSCHETAALPQRQSTHQSV